MMFFGRNERSTGSRLQVVPPPHIISGHIQPLLDDSLGHMVRAHEQYGHCIGMRVGPRWLYSFSHPDDVNQIMVQGWKVYSKRTRVYGLLVPLLGSGLFTSDGEKWKQRRKLAQPAFHKSMLALFSDVMRDEAENLASRWLQKQDVDLVPELAETALRIVARTTLGTSLSEGEIATIRTNLTGSIDGITLRLHSVIAPPLWVPTRANRVLNRNLSTLHALVERLALAQKAATNPEERTIAAMMCENGLPSQALRDELVTFIFAGHESSATGLAWVLYLLGQHPEVAHNVRDELDFLCGNPASVDDLEKLPLLDRVIRETMRLYPPQWGIGRNADIDGDINGTFVPKGAIVGIHPWVTHRSPDFWSDPLRFKPERWEAITDDMKKAWFPFGAGPRNCIGKSFAIMEMKIVLSKLLQLWSFDGVKTTDPTAGLVLRPKGAMNTSLTKLDS